MPVRESASPINAVCRLYWMLLGPLSLYGLAVAIFYAGPGWLTFADIAFWAVLGLTIAARYIEFCDGHACTATGEPATAAHLQRYVAAAVSSGLALWLVAKMFATFGWAG